MKESKGVLELQRQHIRNQREENDALKQQIVLLKQERDSFRSVAFFISIYWQKYEENLSTISELKQKYLVFVMCFPDRQKLKGELKTTKLDLSTVIVITYFEVDGVEVTQC